MALNLKNIARPVEAFVVKLGRAGRLKRTSAGSWVAAHDGSPAADHEPSIAVLPFTNLSGDPEQEYFADGIAEDVTADLSRIAQMTVISRSVTTRTRP